MFGLLDGVYKWTTTFSTSRDTTFATSRSTNTTFATSQSTTTTFSTSKSTTTSYTTSFTTTYTSCTPYYRNDPYWSTPFGIYWFGAYVAAYPGAGVTSITVGSYTYYRGDQYYYDGSGLILWKVRRCGPVNTTTSKTTSRSTTTTFNTSRATTTTFNTTRSTTTTFNTTRSTAFNTTATTSFY